MAKPKKAAARVKQDAARRFRMLNGVRIPEGVTGWRVFRYADPQAKSDGQPCALNLDGRRVASFPLHADETGGPFPPSWDVVLATWGSGTYRLQWFRESVACGFSPPVTFDDPNHPQLPCYSRPQGAASSPSAPAAPPAPSSAAPPIVDMAGALGAAAKDGKIELPMVMLFVQLIQAQAAGQAQMFQQMLAQAEAAQRARESDAARRARENDEHHARQLESLAAFWSAQTRIAREAAAAPATREDDRMDEVVDRLAEVAENVAATNREGKEVWEKLLDTFGPAANAWLASRMGPSNGLPTGEAAKS